MNTTADRSELHELIDSLPEDQVRSAAEDLRRRTQPPPVRSEHALAWVGQGVAKNGITDLSTNPRHLEGFGRESL